MRLRLILAFGFVVLVSVASVVLVLWRTTQREVDTFMFRGGMVGAEQMVNALEGYYRRNGSWEGVKTYFHHNLIPGRRTGQMMRPGMGSMNPRLRLYNSSGELMADTGELGASGQLHEEEKYETITLRSGRAVIGYLLYEGGMAFTQGDQINLLARLNRAALTAASVGVALSFLLAGLLSYQLARPIHELKEGADRLAAGDLSLRVSVQGDAEVASLGVAFNKMATSLQKVEGNRRAMTADIAHELRTPLSVQRAHLEALQDGIYELNAVNLEPVLAQNLLLTRLVEDLRTLALAEAGQLTLHKTLVDLQALTKRTAERFSPQASENQVAIRFEEPQKAIPPVFGDPGRLEQLIGNILTNALSHTPAGGLVTLAVGFTADEASILVRDTGPGISEEALPRIFERFYRADPSRSREEGGSGLGLSIARQLARAHSGDLTAANHFEGGAVFTLTMPLAKEKF
jgi:two-component system, OmpR family, sensor histidine kinase BaeS